MRAVRRGGIKLTEDAFVCNNQGTGLTQALVHVVELAPVEILRLANRNGVLFDDVLVKAEAAHGAANRSKVCLALNDQTLKLCIGLLIILRELGSAQIDQTVDFGILNLAVIVNAGGVEHGAAAVVGVAGQNLHRAHINVVITGFELRKQAAVVRLNAHRNVKACLLQLVTDDVSLRLQRAERKERDGNGITIGIRCGGRRIVVG